MAKTQSYIVMQKHTLGHKIGDEIKLTDHQAKSLVGKVRLKADGAIDKVKTDLIGDLKKSVASLQKDNADLVAEIEILNEAGETLGLKVEELTAEIEVLKKPAEEKGKK